MCDRPSSASPHICSHIRHSYILLEPTTNEQKKPWLCSMLYVPINTHQTSQ